MPQNPALKSQRFALRPIENTAKHNAHLIEMMQDPKIQRYINGYPFSDAEALQGLERFHRNTNNQGFGFWLIYDSLNDCVGMCLLKPMPTREYTGHIETGYWIKPTYWGKRIAAEVAGRLIKYAFNELDLQQVTAVVDPDNIASKKSLLRAGLTYREELIAYDKKLPFYMITKDEYLQSKQQKSKSHDSKEALEY